MLASNYNPKDFEAKIYQEWLKKGVGRPESQTNSQTKYIIFDFDGVLADSIDSEVYAFLNYGDAETKKEARQKTTDFFKVLPVKDWNDQEAIKKSVDRIQQICKYKIEHGFDVFAGFVEEIKKLDNVKFAINTTSNRENVDYLLDRIDLEFDMILTVDDGLNKNDKNQRIIDHFGANPKDVYFITDTIRDYLEAKHLIPEKNILGVAWGWQGAKILSEVFPEDQILNKFSDIHEIFSSHSILMPPPNLTGNMHAGHAFQHFLMDTISRENRLNGIKDLWYPGVDHAGIQLEGVIDKLIKKGEFEEEIKNIDIPDTVAKSDIPHYIKKNETNLYLKLAWQKVTEWRDNQKNQAAVLGDTPDYSRQLFTLDDRANRMVFKAFENYYKDGLIYKDAYLVNWSVGLQTALSDVSGEIEYEKRVDPFVTFEYKPLKFDLRVEKENIPLLAKLHDFFDNNPIQVSTVRPETIFGDVAIAVHPNRLTKLLQKAGFSLDEIAESKNIINNQKHGIEFGIKSLGVSGVELILATEVDENFGTGALKVTPASDITDYKIWQKYLTGDFPHAINRQGKLTEIAGKFEGLTVEESRPVVIKKMLESGDIVLKENAKEYEINEWIKLQREKLKIGIVLKKGEGEDVEIDFLELSIKDQFEFIASIYPDYQIDWNYEHNVSICERSKTVIEPLISEEFFLNYEKKANSTGKSLQQHGLEGIAETNFYSNDYKERAENFVSNITDWCISRDLVWGHQIPVWYNLNVNPEKKLYPYKDVLKTSNSEYSAELPIYIGDEKPDLEGNWEKETKIFDTWFSSCLWPLSTLNFYDYLDQKENLVMIHGGDSFERYDNYLEFIKDWDLDASDYNGIKTNWGSWKRDLQKDLAGYNINVFYPDFPNKLNAKYEEWKIWFEKFLGSMKDPFGYSGDSSIRNLSLLGHSLGGNFLLKYLSENDLKVKNLYLVASCVSVGDFKTNIDLISNIENKVSGNIYIYHSKDDQIVDFREAELIKQKLPKAKLVEFKGKGHFIDPEFNELKNQIILDLRKEKEITDFEKFYSTDEMTTAKEIFYLWIVRMIILGKYFTNRIPFKTVIITPTILDDKGRKMSKSLGNGLDPVAAIDKFSGDALRLAMLGGMIPNRNMKMGGRIADELLTKYRNFGNKIWNVARFLDKPPGS
jgi:valyl-tRNA synthetase/predicted alpha/beta hydrolase family esterase